MDVCDNCNYDSGSFSFPFSGDGIFQVCPRCSAPLGYVHKSNRFFNFEIKLDPTLKKDVIGITDGQGKIRYIRMNVEAQTAVEIPESEARES